MAPRGSRSAQPRKLTFDDYGEPAQEEAIAAAEARLGAHFPEDFRAFLLEHNGTAPEPGDLVLDDETLAPKARRVAIAFILGIGTRPSLDIERLARDYTERIPPGFIPIGRDPGASLFLMRSSGRKKGTLYFWDAEAEHPQGMTLDNVHLAAGSFSALLEKLSGE